MRRRLVLKNRKRFAAVLMIFIMIAVFGKLIINVAASSDKLNDQDISSNYVVVRKGDTLWDIALNNNPDGDIRYYIYKIKELNNITSDNIYAGQIIMLP